MNDIEQQRIADYQRGFNDAALNRPADQTQSLSYALGYLDAKR
jgi:hypothetical protein